MPLHGPDDLGHGFVQRLRDLVPFGQRPQRPGQRHVAEDRHPGLPRHLLDALGQQALAAGHDHGRGVAIPVVAQRHRDVFGVDHDEVCFSDVGHHPLLGQLALQPLAFGAVARVTFRLALLAPDLFARHPQPAPVGALNEQQVDHAQGQPGQDRAARQPPRQKRRPRPGRPRAAARPAPARRADGAPAASRPATPRPPPWRRPSPAGTGPCPRAGGESLRRATAAPAAVPTRPPPPARGWRPAPPAGPRPAPPPAARPARAPAETGRTAAPAQRPVPAGAAVKASRQ